MWTSVASAIYWRRGRGNMWVYNDQLTYSYMRNLAGITEYLGVSTAGGAWTEYVLGGSLNGLTRHFTNQGTVDVYATAGVSDLMGYFAIGGGVFSAVCSTAVPATVWDRNGNINRFMPDPNDLSSLRFVPNLTGAGHLYTTGDKFVTYTDQGRLDIGTNPGPVNRVVSTIADRVNADYSDAILYGSNDPDVGNEHTIYAADGDTDITPEGKSGAHPDTGVDSIHYLADGPTWRGIQAVPGT